MDPRPIQGFLFNNKGNLIVLNRYEDSVRIMFILKKSLYSESLKIIKLQ